MPHKKVTEMDDEQRKAVFANMGHVTKSRSPTYKPPKIHTQRKLVKKPHRVPLKKPTKHKVETKEGKITPMTKRGDALITNWNNRRIDSYAKKENKTTDKNEWKKDDFGGYAIYHNPKNPDIKIHQANVKAHESYGHKYGVWKSDYPHAKFIGGSNTLGGAKEIAEKEEKSNNTIKKKRYKMILDTGSKNDSLLASGKVYSLDEKFGDQLVKDGRAVEYNLDTAKRVVNVDGKEMTWGDYLKKRKNENKLAEEKYQQDTEPIKNKITVKSEQRKKAYYRGQKTGQVWTVHVPFKGGGFQNLTFDEKDDAEKYVEEIKSN